MTRSLARLGLLLFALLACRKPAQDVTPTDVSEAQAACRTEGDYKPGEGEAKLTQLRTLCTAGRECPWLKQIAEICYYYGPRTEGHHHVYTTFSAGGDTTARSDLCDGLRATGLFGSVSPIHVYCNDEKSCSTCGGPGGHR